MSLKNLLGARGLAAIVLGVTFVAGGLAGVVAERSVLSSDDFEGPPLRREERGMREPGGPPPNARIFADDSPVAQLLELTDEQREEINRIIEEDRAKAGAMLQQMRPSLQARYDSTTTAIFNVLTEEQRAEFDRLRSERTEQIRIRFGGRRGGERGEEDRERGGLPPF